MRHALWVQGGFQAIEHVIRSSRAMCSHALWLLCCLMYGNSFMKNEGQCGALPCCLVLCALADTHLKNPVELVAWGGWEPSTARICFVLMPCWTAMMTCGTELMPCWTAMMPCGTELVLAHTLSERHMLLC